jgi:hypothetical protein
VLTAIANAFPRSGASAQDPLHARDHRSCIRVGSFIPVPGVDTGSVIQDIIEGQATLGLLNLFSGGALEQFAVFSLGIMPYITASIIMQLLQGVIPTVERGPRKARPASARSRRPPAT